MRLPSASELASDSARALHAHDLLEIHCPDENSFYSQMHRSRVHTVLECATRANGGRRRVLDLGCAQGNTALLLAEAGWDACAVDLRPEFLAYARLKHERGSFLAIAANATSLPFPAASFDLVVWGEMIEHVAYPEQILAQIAQVVRPGGHLLLTTPNGLRLRTGLPTYSQVADRTALEHRQFQPDSNGHLFLFRRDELAGLLHNAGFVVREHHFYATPWVSGRLGARHLIRWLSPQSRSRMDRWTLRLSPLAKRIAEGQVMLAQRMSI